MWTKKIEHLFRYLMPSPLTIAFILTAIVFSSALFFTDLSVSSLANKWSEGLWKPNLLAFAVQMMLMLVLGYIIALSSTVNKLIHQLLKPCNTTAKAAFFITSSTILVAYFNWGLALIYGAIFARKIGEYASEKKFNLNYPLIGACGYIGLMVWHGGFSGSAPLKVNESGHIKNLAQGLFSEEIIAQLPVRIGLQETLFSFQNIITSIAILLIIPAVVYWIGKKLPGKTMHLAPSKGEVIASPTDKVIGIEKWENNNFSALVPGIIILLVWFLLWKKEAYSSFYFVPNNINLLLLSIALITQKSIASFIRHLDTAIKSSSGILIQFPLYFGIMALITQSGLAQIITDQVIAWSGPNTYYYFTFIASGVLNVFIPSGGGQWIVQGPLIIEACQAFNLNIAKAVLAMSYGDQLTNMLQPFWALPLLGITQLKAREILPYCLILLTLGFCIFSCSILFL